MSEQFYNPYQFVPVNACEDKNTTSYLKQKDGLKGDDNRFVRHDYWHKDGLSGRIHCTLTAVSPIVIGGQQTKDDKDSNQPGQVIPYKDQSGNPAIPANTLRGMIGSIAETLSQSAMRVLAAAEKGEYSVRKPAEDSLTKQGHIEIDDESGHYYLRPVDEPERRLPVKKEVVEVLEGIYQALHERDKDNKDKSLRTVKSGDKIRYASSGKNENEWVTELSYSSIWRKAVKGSLYKAFKKSGKNTLPWNSDRDKLTPAEALFGVTEKQPDEQKRGGARNLASRLHFTDATNREGVELDDNVLLKVLSLPEPPSPSLYFHDKGGNYIPKNKLNLNLHTPNGRKVYLPHPRSLKTTEPHCDWISQKDKDLHMQLCAQPIQAQSQFFFHIYFENLSEAELGLLITTLQPDGKQDPEHPTFIHRIGLGKPIGLGHATIAIDSIETINRKQIYSVAGIKQKRYQTWEGEVDTCLVDQKAWDTLKTLSNPSLIKFPVCYPYSSKATYDKNGRIKDYPQKAYNEHDGYRWFVENDRGGKNVKHQALAKALPDKAPRPLESE